MHPMTLSPDLKLDDTGQLELVSSGTGPSDLFGGACFVSMCLDECGRIDAVEDSPLALTTHRQPGPPALALTSYRSMTPGRGDVVIWHRMAAAQRPIVRREEPWRRRSERSRKHLISSLGFAVCWQRCLAPGRSESIACDPACVRLSTAPAGPADIRALQRAVRATPDNVAGPSLSVLLYALAAAPAGREDRRGLHAVRGRHRAGWDASEEAHDATVEAVQAAVGAEVDGVYGAETAAGERPARQGRT